MEKIRKNFIYSIKVKNKFNIVFDIGKENAKIILFDQDGKIIKLLKTKYPLIKFKKNFYFKNINFLINWFKNKIYSLNKKYKIDSIITSTHGAAIGLIDKNEKILFGIMDYENDYQSIDKQFNKILPKYNTTFSPNSEKGLSLGKQILYIKLKHKKIYNQIQNILTLPQFISWIFSKKKVSEITYLGNHTHLWNFKKNNFSSLVNKLNIKKKFPKIKKAGTVIGYYIFDKRIAEQKIKILNGIHDSDAAYSLFLNSKVKKFNIISSGTHFVLMNPNVSTRFLIQNKDMYSGLNIYGKKVPTIRFMGGREYNDLIEKFNLKNFKKSFYKDFFNKKNFLYPTFGIGGPFQKIKGKLNNLKFRNKNEKYMATVTYIAFATNYCLDLLKSKNNIIITGPLINNTDILQILNSLKDKKKIYLYSGQEATAVGCNMLNKKNYEIELKIFKCKKINQIQEAYDYWEKKINKLSY